MGLAILLVFTCRQIEFNITIFSFTARLSLYKCIELLDVSSVWFSPPRSHEAVALSQDSSRVLSVIMTLLSISIGKYLIVIRESLQLDRLLGPMFSAFKKNFYIQGASTNLARTFFDFVKICGRGGNLNTVPVIVKLRVVSKLLVTSGAV